MPRSNIKTVKAWLVLDSKGFTWDMQIGKTWVPHPYSSKTSALRAKINLQKRWLIDLQVRQAEINFSLPLSVKKLKK